MGRLNNVAEKTPDQIIIERLDPWLNNVPDFDDVQTTYKELARLKREIRLKQREITRVEEYVIAGTEKPRSNETRQEKLKATGTLKDDLADLEAQEQELSTLVALLEYRKTMFSASGYRIKLLQQI